MLWGIPLCPKEQINVFASVIMNYSFPPNCVELKV